MLLEAVGDMPIASEARHSARGPSAPGCLGGGGVYVMSKIAELNDQFRKTFDQRLGGVILTHAVAELHFTVQMSIIE